MNRELSEFLGTNSPPDSPANHLSGMENQFFHRDMDLGSKMSSMLPRKSSVQTMYLDGDITAKLLEYFRYLKSTN